MIISQTVKIMLITTALLVSTPVSALDSKLDGRWVGNMRQVNIDSEDTYPVKLTLSQESGTTEYPSLKCGGSLHRLTTVNGQTVFIETITHGRARPDNDEGCIDGIIVVQTYRSTLVLEWSGSYMGEPYVATAILKKAQKTEKSPDKN